MNYQDYKRRARCIMAHPDRLRGDRAAGQDQRRVPVAGRVRAAVYASRAGQQRRHVHRHWQRADDHGVQPYNSRAAALYLRTRTGAHHPRPRRRYDLVCREPAPGDNPIEQTANVFASRLLAPACVLWGCGVQSAEDIAQLCDISRAAAEFRWSRMQELYRRQRFLTSPLERLVYAHSRIISKVIGFRELVDERFQSGDLFVAQILLDIRTIAAGNFHDVSMIVKLRVSLLIIPSHEICSGYADCFPRFFPAGRAGYSLLCQFHIYK